MERPPWCGRVTLHVLDSHVQLVAVIMDSADIRPSWNLPHHLPRSVEMHPKEGKRNFREF